MSKVLASPCALILGYIALLCMSKYGLVNRDMLYLYKEVRAIYSGQRPCWREHI